MPIRFKCPTCERMLSIARRKAGTRVVCPRCEDDVTVPDADLAYEEEVNVEPVEDHEPGSGTKPIAIGAPPKPTQPKPKPKSDKLFEESDFEQLLDAKVKKAADDAAAKKPEPQQAVVPAAASPDPVEKGILLSRGAAVVLTVLMLVLLALAFATGYLIGR